MNILIAANAKLCFILWMRFEHAVLHVDSKEATSLVLGRSREGHKCSHVRALVAMIYAILLMLTSRIDIVFEFSSCSLCIEGCEPCVLRSSHAVIPRRSQNAHVDTYIIQQMQRYKIHEHFAFIAGL
jgi:hypothetical protein